MIDEDGYRPNVGIIICNRQRQLFWAKRRGQAAWQFPQGGIHSGETTEEAMYRELFEEVGLNKNDVQLLAKSHYWLRYNLPKRFIRVNNQPLCIGQKQKWFLLYLRTDESQINIRATNHPEFDGWRWVSYWYPIRQAAHFKLNVYRRAMHEFSSVPIPGTESTRKWDN